MIKKLKKVRRRKKKQWLAAIQSNKVLNSNTQLQNVFLYRKYSTPKLFSHNLWNYTHFVLSKYTT